MEFTLKSSHQHTPALSHSHSRQLPALSHASQIQDEMLRILNRNETNENNNDNKDLISYIEASLPCQHSIIF